VVSASQTSNVETLEEDVAVGARSDEVVLHARAIALSDSNVLLLVEDNTESKRVEETRRDFITNVSHELKTPIAALRLYLDTLLMREPEAADRREFYETMNRNEMMCHP
jgi:two-component system sensor histidine kinase SenX3